MSTIAPGAIFTPVNLLRLPDAVSFELVEGQLLERNMGLESSAIAMRIAVVIGIFLEDRSLGRLVGADAGYQCFTDAPDKVRKPDVSFIRAGRLPGNVPPRGHCRIAPDLTVEVISPGDLAYEVEEKVAEYIAAGVPLVWVVYPTTRTVRVHRLPSSPWGVVAELRETDAITGEDILPGFSAAVQAFFK